MSRSGPPGQATHDLRERTAARGRRQVERYGQWDGTARAAGKRPAREQSEGVGARRQRRASGADGGVAGGSDAPPANGVVVLAQQGRHGEGEASGDGDSHGAAGSSAVHAAVGTRQAEATVSDGASEGECDGVRAQARKRCRGAAAGGEMAVKRFVAFVEGERVARVVMVSGVQVIAGERKRARWAVSEQQRRQRQRAVSHANCYASHDLRYVQRGDSDSDGDDERQAAGERLRRQRQQGEQRGEQRLSADGSSDYINRADDNANQPRGAGEGTIRSAAERAAVGEGPGGLGDRTGVG